MANYTIYTGQWVCHTCHVEVKTLRLYPETKTATWMCPEKHISKVSFMNKRKKDYEREKRK